MEWFINLKLLPHETVKLIESNSGLGKLLGGREVINTMHND